MEIPPVTRTIAHCESQSSKPELGLIFVLLVAISVTLTAFLPAAFFNFWRRLVMSIAVMMGGLVGLSVTSQADILTVNGFAMRVIDECTALNYVIILSTAILLYTRHSIRYRLIGVLVVIPVIVLANAFRLVITGVSGTISRRMFDLVHEYIWVALFALLIFGLWKVWADRSFHLNREVAWRVAAIIVGCSSTYALILVIMPIYGPTLARLSSLVLKVLTWESNATIFWAGSKMECSHAGASYQVPFVLEYFNIAVFAGLVLPLQSKGDWKTLASTFIGLIGAILLNAALIATTIHTMMAHGQKSLPAFFFIENGLLLAAPFALWWIVASSERSPVRQSIL